MLSADPAIVPGVLQSRWLWSRRGQWSCQQEQYHAVDSKSLAGAGFHPSTATCQRRGLLASLHLDILTKSTEIIIGINSVQLM